MLLAIDIGNTNIVAGVFDGPASLSIVADRDEAGPDGGRVRLGSERPLFGRGTDAPRQSGRPLRRPAARSGIGGSGIPVFRRVGGGRQGRLEDGSPARHRPARRIGSRPPGERGGGVPQVRGPLVVVDFGTATTFCAVTADGVYKGGAILPESR